MMDETVLRVVIDGESVNKKKDSSMLQSSGTGAVSGYAAATISSNNKQEFKYRDLFTGEVKSANELSYRKLLSNRRSAKYNANLYKLGIEQNPEFFTQEMVDSFEDSRSHLSMELHKRNKSLMRKGTGLASIAAMMYSEYSQYKSIGLNLSGATHSAQLQNRQSQMVNTAVSMGISATVNPMLAPLTLAMKAYQTSMTNRQEIYKMKSEQIHSSIMQELLVRDTLERRF